MTRGVKTGGRQKGSLNKSTAELKSLAGVHTEAALKKIVHLMAKAESEQVQMAAAKELLDRAHGRPAQAVNLGGDEDNPIKIINEIVRRVVDADHRDG